MEEEDELTLLDYRTPKGQLIKLLEQKMKKPEIDDSLGKVLDQFLQLTNEQTTFLENGIFQMNFAEDALLLQICGQYYGKRVDKLWDELLQFHTRMVKYDETTAKNCTDRGKKEARKLEVEKLEERLNRGKRKKIKLADPETDTPQTGCYVFDVDQNAGQELFDRANLLQEETEEEAVPPFEHNFDIFDDWREIHLIDELERKKRGSIVVSQYNKQKYRLKHYSIPNGDEIIYDWKDSEEFNTREGRLISVHHIRHLFEYNDRCLLPDEDFTIAKLRFAYVLKKKWLVEHKIDADAPYETYKAEYEKYQREYFENEKRKIQNMPQRNSEDLMKFYKALEKKEQLARQAQEKLRLAGVKNLPEISFETLILDPLKEGYQGDYDPYIPVDDESQAGSAQIPTECDHEMELSDLFVNIPKLPATSAEAADTLRSDSGYFDGGFEADDDSEHEDNTDASVLGTNTPFELDKDNNNSENKGEETTLDKTSEGVTQETEVTEEPSMDASAVVETTENDMTDGNEGLETSFDDSLIALNDQPAQVSSEQCSLCIEDRELESIDNEAMNREIREFVKLGTVDETFSYSILENSFFKKTEDVIMILYNKERDDDESANQSLGSDTIIQVGARFDKEDMNKSEKAKNKDKQTENKKRKLEERQNDDDPLPKRRKLTQRQVERLRKSLIEPVKEARWESFFSMNYQTEAMEGDITRLDYESASDDEDDVDLDVDNQDDVEDHDDDKIEESTQLNASGYHSDGEGSHTNEHCRPDTPFPLSQDSGVGSMDTPFPLSQDSGVGSMDTPFPLSQDSGVGSLDLSTLGECSQTSEKDTQPNKNTTSNKESDLVELSSIDLIAELSKNTGISREELAKQQLAEKPELTQHEQQREKVRERVTEWKEHIMPKLKKLDEHDFDIHEYGSKIMGSINVDEKKPFSELVAGKSSAEVVRFFISSLQLANTMNVEICGAKKGELSNDSFELKLLSKERYHEHLVEYQAPSEESLGEKLKKVKQIRMQNKMQAKQSLMKRKAAVETVVDQNHVQQLKPQSIMKRSAARSTKNTPSSVNSSNDSNSVCLSSPCKKIKILNYHLISSDQQLLAAPQRSVSYDFQQPSTSWQSEPESPISEVTSPLAHTPSRSSIDSGFMPSCDEDFLDQFDQLQQTSDTQLRSTPIKPRRVLRVSFARNTNF